MARRPSLVIGVGNLHRHDDALGIEAANAVRRRLGERVRVLPFDGEATGLLELWTGEPHVILADALRSHGTPGRLHRFEGDLTPLLAEAPTSSTHGLSVGEAWRLGGLLGQRPDRLVVFGVEAEDFSPGLGLSPAVAAAMPSLTEAIVAEVLGTPTVPKGRAHA